MLVSVAAIDLSYLSVVFRVLVAENSMSQWSHPVLILGDMH